MLYAIFIVAPQEEYC